jgi:hypothetical protein
MHMDTTLVTVTVLSMGMAAALSVIVWRMLRDERRRSDARVAALTQAAAVGRPAGDIRHRVLANGDLPLRAAVPPAREPVLTPAAAPAPAMLNMFVEPARSTPWRNRFAVMGGIALLGASVALFAMAGRTRPARPDAVSSLQAPTFNAGAPGLELLSLRDARSTDALTITGMVRNPRGAAARSRVAVTAYAFDDKGAFLASGRALLDVTALAPGDDSPFVVTVPVTDNVARYRIGFRAEDGRVIAHVDRRQPGPMAAVVPGAGQGQW